MRGLVSFNPVASFRLELHSDHRAEAGHGHVLAAGPHGVQIERDPLIRVQPDPAPIDAWAIGGIRTPVRVLTRTETAARDEVADPWSSRFRLRAGTPRAQYDE